jgi:hypothetical protein
VVGISAGVDDCLAVAADGTFWAWGINTEGNLGDGTTTTQLSPEHLSFPDGSQTIGMAGGGVAGYSFSVSLQSDWSWRSWGSVGYYPEFPKGALGRVVTGSYSATPGVVIPF